MSETVTPENTRLEFVSTTALFMGMLSLGVALGATLGLHQLQSACIAAGVLPAPGTAMTTVNLESNPCWTGAKTLQSAGNAAGVGAAVFLLTGAVVDSFGERIRALIGKTAQEDTA